MYASLYTPHQIGQLGFWSNRSQAASVGLSIHCKHWWGHYVVLGPLAHAEVHPTVFISVIAIMPALLLMDLIVTLPSGKPQK